MKRYIFIFAFLVFIQSLFAQQVTSYREATLQKTGYTITGKAFLELYDNGKLKLRLDEEFNTERGPDVQIFLSNSTSITDGIMIANLGYSGGIDHFDGAITFDITEIDISTYSKIIFHCVAFNAPWAIGEFNSTITPYICQETITATTGWVSEKNICQSDDLADQIPLKNNKSIPAGDHYAYVITDESNLIRYLHFEDLLDFEKKGNETDLVYGVSFDGQLNYTTGASFNTITASGCHILSGTDIFLTVNKDNCSTITKLPSDASTNNNNRLSIYPNPTYNRIIIRSNTLNTSDYRLYDIHGKLLNLEINDNEFDLSTYPSGVYILRQGQDMVKIIKS